MEKIKVFLVDRQVLFLQGMRMALSAEDGIEVVSESDKYEEVPSLVETFSPDVVLMDACLPSLRGLDIARQITQRSPGVPVIILTPYEDDDQLFLAIKSGAAAYLSKSITTEELASAIRRVFEGEHPISESFLTKPRVASRVLKQFQDLSLIGKGVEALVAPLSPREIEILGHVADGNSNKQIAHNLKISEQTIKNHITSILRKLDANDRTHAVVLALRHGWISME